MKKTVNAPVWCSYPENLGEIYEHKDPSRLPDSCYVNNADMSDMGWIRIGTATIHLDLINPKDTIAAQVESLEAQCKKVMADSEATLTMLRSKINDLLAIEGGS